VIALLQRVAQARVEVDGAAVGAIDAGLLALVCAEPGDTPDVSRRMIEKVLKLRVFADAAGKMNRSLQDIGGGLLIVSQFTLAADTSSGNRPGFSAAAPSALGRVLYEDLLRVARELHPVVAAGVFGADMQIHLVNDGPVTIPITLR
jgi:D-aminoacyl-tRNA deacylase